MPATSSATTHLRFALAVHRVLAGHGGNSCFSPYSAACALTLVARAARGTTASEAAELLAGSASGLADQAALLRKGSQLDAGGGGEEPVLATSTTLWVWQKLPIKAGFTTELAEWPEGRVATAPFVDDPESARHTINADVARTTRDLIPELLPDGTVDSDTVAGLVNALYLRVAWTFPFPDADTTDGDFHAPGGTRRVPMMRQTERLSYARHGQWQVVVLPAMGGVEAVVLLPDERIPDAESTLDDMSLAEMLAAPRERMVTLAMPRVSLDVRSALKPALRELGVRTMFERSADFGELTDDPRLVVSDVAHQAVLRTDENGLEGAAATAAMMRLVSMPLGDPVEVDVDRPFLLLVRHASSGAVYFLARVVEP